MSNQADRPQVGRAGEPKRSVPGGGNQVLAVHVGARRSSGPPSHSAHGRILRQWIDRSHADFQAPGCTAPPRQGRRPRFIVHCGTLLLAELSVRPLYWLTNRPVKTSFSRRIGGGWMKRIATTIADISSTASPPNSTCRGETWQSGSVSTAPRYARVWHDCNRWAWSRVRARQRQWS